MYLSCEMQFASSRHRQGGSCACFPVTERYQQEIFRWRSSKNMRDGVVSCAKGSAATRREVTTVREPYLVHTSTHTHTHMRVPYIGCWMMLLVLLLRVCVFVWLLAGVRDHPVRCHLELEGRSWGKVGAAEWRSPWTGGRIVERLLFLFRSRSSGTRVGGQIRSHCCEMCSLGAVQFLFLLPSCVALGRERVRVGCCVLIVNFLLLFSSAVAWRFEGARGMDAYGS